MHGRVKVRTSEEEKQRKEKERAEKLKIFKHAMLKIQNKRKNLELDNELLDLTGKVLTSNPDIYTLWNIRKEILLLFSKDDAIQDKMSELYNSELYLTECCLKINPKSYGSWHQREWVLTTRSDPNWNKELMLCNMYLKLDERNFHTWDYRRFVIKHYKLPLKDEFDYTTEKLLDNFSNYSAWHYRSKMLMELYPDVEGDSPIDSTHHKHELKMVQSATFTDPDDTSAWFYQRWLLGAVKNDVKLVVCVVSPSKTFVVFNQSVSQSFIENNIHIYLDNNKINGNWSSCTGNQYDTLWLLNHNETVTADMCVKVHYVFDNKDEKIDCKPSEPSFYVGRNAISFQKEYSETVMKELKEQLESCRQLLALEPDNKCTLLTTTVFLNCIDATSYHREIVENLTTLQNVDKLRAGYYNDLKDKLCIENQLYDDYNSCQSECTIRFEGKIASLPHLQYYSYCYTVDFSDQDLASNVLPTLVLLQSCKRLSLKNNKITSLKGFPCMDLEELNLQGNPLEEKIVENLRKNVNYKVLF